MKRITTLIIALLAFTLCATQLHAQTPTITISSTDNKTSRQITVNTKVANIPTGSSVKSVTVLASPSGGAAGLGGKAEAKDTGGGVWSGTITGLTSGTTYTIDAILIVIDKNLNQYSYFPKTQDVKAG